MLIVVSCSPSAPMVDAIELITLTCSSTDICLFGFRVGSELVKAFSRLISFPPHRMLKHLPVKVSAELVAKMAYAGSSVSIFLYI